MMGQFWINHCPILDNFRKKGGGLTVLAAAPTAASSYETALYILFMVVGRWSFAEELLYERNMLSPNSHFI
jgi:hypothetical protein